MRAAGNAILQPGEEEAIAAAYNQTLAPQRVPGKSQARGKVVCVQGDEAGVKVRGCKRRRWILHRWLGHNLDVVTKPQAEGEVAPGVPLVLQETRKFR